MAQKVDIGVVRSSIADIVSNPTISNIGVPTENSSVLLTGDNQPQSAINKRGDVHPAARLSRVRGIGVPLNPNDGLTTT